MLPPIRCFECGRPIADKWIRFQNLVNEYESEMKDEDFENIDIYNKKVYVNQPQYKALVKLFTGKEPQKDELMLKDYVKEKGLCCIKNMLCSVDL